MKLTDLIAGMKKLGYEYHKVNIGCNKESRRWLKSYKEYKKRHPEFGLEEPFHEIRHYFRRLGGWSLVIYAADEGFITSIEHGYVTKLRRVSYRNLYLDPAARKLTYKTKREEIVLDL